MGLRSLGLKKTYSSDFDDILQDFYVPALRESCHYDRLAGFFSSTSLAVAARGILGLVANGGTMKLIASPRLTLEDVEAIVRAGRDADAVLEEKLLGELDHLEDEFARDHVSALAWMVANGRLSIRVAVPQSAQGKPLDCEAAQQSGLFHQKVGILRDASGDTISFSGSVNESAAGWLRNVEEFKVFRGWEPAEDDYVRADSAKFERFWANRSPMVRVVELPRAVQEKLVEIAPEDVEGLDLERYYGALRRRRGVQLFPHQVGAIDAWVQNGMRGIFAMATGTGKTFAALGCLERASRMSGGLVAVVACPYQHLVQQWRREIEGFGIAYDQLVVADGSSRGWRDALADALMDVSLGYKANLVVLTTHATFASRDFMGIVRGHKGGMKTLLIGDEVHGLGAAGRRRGLVEEYDLRLGLSATPRRWFDASGTDAVYGFFGGEVFRFGLEEAINTENPMTGHTYLVPYRYVPRFAWLGLDEMEEYAEKTRRIGRAAGRSTRSEDDAKYLESLLFARADIIKNAEGKYEVLEQLLQEIGAGIKWTIVYCSPQQIDTVMQMVNRRRIVAHRFTMEEGTVPRDEYGGVSERDFLLEEFEKGTYQALVAMKCLDEGVDVPPARTAVLMASSGNPREHIQRIGRVIRRCSGKTEATVYDIIVLPPPESVPPELRELERRIVQREAERYEEIARTAINNAEALAAISDAMSVWR